MCVYIVFDFRIPFVFITIAKLAEQAEDNCVNPLAVSLSVHAARRVLSPTLFPFHSSLLTCFFLHFNLGTLTRFVWQQLVKLATVRVCDCVCETVCVADDFIHTIRYDFRIYLSIHKCSNLLNASHVPFNALINLRVVNSHYQLPHISIA